MVDVYHFLEVDFVGLFKWDLLMRLPVFFCVFVSGSVLMVRSGYGLIEYPSICSSARGKVVKAR